VINRRYDYGIGVMQGIENPHLSLMVKGWAER